MDYFELFGLPVAPSADKAVLARKYFELQRKNHPDYFSRGTEIEKEDALKQSADINKAFVIFQHPEKTIEYFLQLKGLVVENEKFTLPSEFLMEMMEINETLTDGDEVLAKKQVNIYNTGLDEEISPVIKNYENEKSNDAELLKLKDYFYKKKYLKRILDRLSD